MSLRVTAGIVSWKTPELARRCWASIMRQRYYLRWLQHVEIVHADKHDLGYAESLQQAFEWADTPLLLALNADVEFPQEDITPLLELFDQHPRLGVLGPRQRDSRGFLTHCGITTLGSTDGGRHFSELDQGQATEPYAPVAQVSGSVMFIRREAWQDVGEFHGYPRLYYEDAGLCLRMARRDWRVAYSGRLTFTHDIASSPCENRAELAAVARSWWQDELAEAPTP
jgi:GT2 family glycosyltransferase